MCATAVKIVCLSMRGGVCVSVPVFVSKPHTFVRVRFVPLFVQFGTL